MDSNMLAVSHSSALRNLPTDKKDIFTKKGKGNKELKYIKRITAMRWLDLHYPEWSFEAKGVIGNDKNKDFLGFVSVIGELTVVEPDSRRIRTIRCIGTMELIYGGEPKELTVQEYLKGAETDSLKRCVFTLGGFTDVYTEEKLETQISKADADWLIGEIIIPVFSLEKSDFDSMKLLKLCFFFVKGLVSKERIKETFSEILGK